MAGELRALTADRLKSNQTDMGTARPQTRGILTLATKHRMYVEMAVDFALSLREHSSDPVSIVVDDKMRPLVESRYADIFDQVVTLPAAYRFGRAARYAFARLTPYDRTLSIDADTLVLKPFDFLWAKTEALPLAMMGEMLDITDPQVHHGMTIPFLTSTLELKRYFKTAGAVFYFHRAGAAPLLDACFEAYRERAYPRLRWAGDEIGFAIVGAERGIDTLPRPWPILWRHQLADLDPQDPPSPLYTILGQANRPAMNWLMAQVKRRRIEAGLPLVSEPYWRLKAWTSAGARWSRSLRPVLMWLIDLRNVFANTSAGGRLAAAKRQ